MQDRGFRERGGGSLQEQRESHIASCVDLFFREAGDLRTFPSERREQLLTELVDRFRDFLSDEEPGDDRGVARALQGALANFVDRYPSTAEREMIIRVCSESAIAMSARERDELKRFADYFYFDDEDEHAFISLSDRNRLVRELVDGLVAADEMHEPGAFEGSEDEVRRHGLIEKTFENLVDTLHFEGNIEELKGIFLIAFSSRGELTERDRARITEILREEGEIWQGVMLARSLELFDPVQRGPSQRIQELQRLRLEGILFSQESFVEQNICSAITAVFQRRIALPGTRFSFKNFFPGEERVSEETAQHLLEIASERIVFYLPGVLKGLAREFAERPSYHAYCVESLFSRIHCFTSEFLRQIPPSLEGEARKLFEDALARGGGDAYAQWRNREDLKRDAVRVHSEQIGQEIIDSRAASKTSPEPVPVPEPARVSIPVQEFVPPPAALTVHASPLVIAPSRHAEPSRSLREREEYDIYAAENVLARIAAGELLHLAEDIRKHPKRFADALRDHDVQSAAWRALEQAMGRGLFGVVERAAPIFLGEDWKREDPSLRFVARRYFVQELVAERRGDVGHRLPEAVLKQKALGFGFDWDELTKEAEAQLPKKRKGKK